MDWKETLSDLIQNGCTDSDIEDFVNAHPDINAKDIWDYACEHDAPDACKGCAFIQMSGMMPCVQCRRKVQLNDYYEPRQPADQ